MPMERWAEGYTRWYVYVEKAIVEMLEGLGYAIDAGNSGKGHRYHEAVLELLQDPTNLFHEILGESETHQFLKTGKKFRNIWTGDRRFSESLNPVTCRTNIGGLLLVELALWGAFGIFISELKHKNAKEREDRIQEQKRKREQDQLLSDKEKLKDDEIKLQKLASEKEQEWNKYALEAEKFRTVNSELERQNKEACKQLGTKTAFKKEVEKLKGTVKELKDSRAADTKKATQDAAEKEKVHEQDAKAVIQAHEREINRLKETHEREIEQLREAHKREEEARQTTYYAESKAMIIGHQHSLGLETPSKAVEELAKDGGVDLASMIRTMMASHVKDRIAAKSLKEEVGRLRDQVANYESYKQTDFGIVQALMEKMEGCTEPGHRTLKSLFAKRDFPAL